MTAIYSLAPATNADATLTTINTNIDGLETAVGTASDAPSATGSLLARLGAIAAFVDGLESAVGTAGDAASATGSIAARLGNVIAQLTTIAGFVDGLEGFTDGIEAVLGIASATPGANTINANILRTIRAASNCSQAVVGPVSVAVAGTGGTASTLATAAAAGTDWRRISIFNSGSVSIFLAVGALATASAYTMPVPAGYLLTLETTQSVTALSSAGATSVLVTVET